MAFVIPLLEVGAEVGIEAGLVGAETGTIFGVETAMVATEASEIGAVEMVGLETMEVPEVLTQDFLSLDTIPETIEPVSQTEFVSVGDVSELPSTEIQQVEEYTLPENIESDFMSVPETSEIPEIPEFSQGVEQDIPMYEDTEIQQFVEEEFGEQEEIIEEITDDVSPDDELVERRVNLNDLPEELEKENIFSKIEEVKGNIQDKINFLKGRYQQSYEYLNNIYQNIKNTKLFKLGKISVSIGSVIQFVQFIKKTVDKGKEIRDIGKEFEDWYDKNKPVVQDIDDKTKGDEDEGKLNYTEMIDLVKTFNNKQETIEFLSKHREEYEKLTPEEKRQLLKISRENF